MIPYKIIVNGCPKQLHYGIIVGFVRKSMLYKNKQDCLI
jgi:hypothetical protein